MPAARKAVVCREKSRWIEWATGTTECSTRQIEQCLDVLTSSSEWKCSTCAVAVTDTSTRQRTTSHLAGRLGRACWCQLTCISDQKLLLVVKIDPYLSHHSTLILDLVRPLDRLVTSTFGFVRLLLSVPCSLFPVPSVL